MPCSYDGPSSYDILRAETDQVTQLLCEVFASHPEIVELSDKHKAWWTLHQEQDRKRREREAEEKARWIGPKCPCGRPVADRNDAGDKGKYCTPEHAWYGVKR